MALATDKPVAAQGRDRRREAPAHLAPPRTRSGPWQVFGVAVVAFCMLAATELAVVTGPEALDGPRFLRGALLVVGVLAVAAWIVAAVAAPVDRLGEIPGRAASLWTGADRHWPAALAGFLVSLPVLSLYTPIGLGDSDSVRIVATVNYVQRHGLGYLTDTQDIFGPHLALGPALAVGGLAAVRLVSVLSVQALVAATAYTVHRISGSTAAALGASLALLSTPAVLDRATLIPMYPAMLAAGTLASWLAYRAMTTPRGWGYAAGAAVCLVATVELHNVGQLFLGVPVLLLIMARPLPVAVAGLVRTGALTALLGIPRLAVNLSKDGLNDLVSNRTDYWIEKGYVTRIQTELLGYEGVDEPLGTYLERLPGRFVTSLGAEGWLALGLAAVALVGLRGRARAFGLACAGLMLAAITVKQIPPFARYYSPVWPGIAVLAGLAVAWLARRRWIAGRVLAGAALAALVVLSALSYRQVAEHTAEKASAVEAMPYHELARLIDDGKGVIGSRSHVLVQVDAGIATYGGQFLSEREYVTYLTWPSDAAVIEVLERHDIGWVLVNPSVMLETAYHNTWLVPAYGLESRQATAVARSPAFCQVAAIGGFRLYRLGACSSATS